MTTNPLYLALVLLITALVWTIWRTPSRLAQTYRLFILLGFVLWLGYAAFSVITIGGARGQTALVSLPVVQLPPLLGGLTLGGVITAEDLVWGASRGLRIWTLLAIFGVFNSLIDHYRLLRQTPRSLFHAGLAVTIAITFVPQFVRSIAAITQAQRLRGHRFRGPQSYVPLIAPLLAGSLESSLQLAEALDARGYGRTHPTNQAFRWQQLGVITGLLALGAGLFLWLYYGASVLGALLFLGGISMLGLALRSLGQRVSRTTYRRERWHRRDGVTIAASMLAAVAWIAVRVVSYGGLVYNPYPRISMPAFVPLVALIVFGLAAPAIFRPPMEHRPKRAAIIRREPISLEG